MWCILLAYNVVHLKHAQVIFIWLTDEDSVSNLFPTRTVTSCLDILPTYLYNNTMVTMTLLGGGQL